MLKRNQKESLGLYCENITKENILSPEANSLLIGQVIVLLL
jgi:hypothetical protein